MCTYVVASTCVNNDVHKNVRTYSVNEYAQMYIYIYIYVIDYMYVYIDIHHLLDMWGVLWGYEVHLMHTVQLYLCTVRLCEVWVGNQLEEGLYEAPRPTDCHTTTAMTDIVLVVMWDIEHTIKTNIVHRYLQRQCVTVAIPHSLLESWTHAGIYIYIL